MATFPSGAPTGIVYGRYAFLSSDGMDAGTAPDLSPMSGLVRLVPRAPKGPITWEYEPKRTIGFILEEYVLEFDAEGNLVDLDGSAEIELLATDSAKLNRQGWQWEAQFEILRRSTGKRLDIPPFRFEVPAGGRVDLPGQAPIINSDGIPTVRGPKGDAGRDGSNVLPTDRAIAQAFNDRTSETYATLLQILLSAGINPYVGPIQDPENVGLAFFPVGEGAPIEDPEYPGLYFIEPNDGFIEDPVNPGLLTYKG